MKAAFVYNFALFTEWPVELPDAGAPLNICINHDGALRPALAALNDKLIKGRRIAVIRLSDGREDVRHCQVLFLGSADRDRWERIKKSIGSASVLTVSDDGDIGRSGAIITLYLENGHVAFEIDMDAARKAHLTLSSRLLRLARVVR